MRMLSHVSELPCLTLLIRLVCPLADRKPSKQNSCRWQYKIGSPGATTNTSPGEIPILWRTAFQAEYHVGDCPGTPPLSVYQVTHGTAFQAAERLRFLFLPRS